MSVDLVYATSIVTNYVEKGAVSTATFVVPTGKRWLVYGGCAQRDQNATLDIGIYDASDNLIMAFAQVAAGVTTISWGFMATASAQALYEPLPLDTGMYVKYTWGVAQTSPTVTCLVVQASVSKI